MSLRNLFRNRKQNQLKSADEKLSLLKPLNMNPIKTNYDAKLLLPVTPMDNDSTLIDFGYKILKKTDISQGQLIKACLIEDKTQIFMIKKVDKQLFSFSQKTDNIITEASLLRYCSDSKYICKYIDLFDDEKYYYLVTEYAGDITLDKWVQIAFEYVKNGKLNIKEYRNKVKYISYQLLSLLNFLHNDRQLCHLRIEMENIIISGCQFLHDANNTISIPGDIQIKLLCNFSTSKPFNIQSEKFDIYLLGVLLFRLTFGEYPSDSALRANKYNRLSYYLCMNNLSQYATQSMLTIICQLLMFDGTKRFNLSKIIKCKCFAQ